MQQLLLVFGLLISQFAFAQQTVRGTVLDADTRQPLPFVTIVLVGSDPTVGTTTDLDGTFRLEQVPIGLHTFSASFLGYEPISLPNVDVTTGKEVVLNLELTEAVTKIQEVVVRADRDKSKVVNELATVSTRSLSLDEANRYAASISDPARQAQNFAGVAGGGDDLSNDIVIRGNSPRGLLWRLEGIEIPNPNHFGDAGASGGGVSMLSSNVLATSDFLTGAFPAEYGNALSGVFDLRYRKGNNEKREWTAAAGFLGLELAGEGPFKKGGKSSYLVNYRFSTLSVLDRIGLSVAGDFLPNYQDLNYNLTFPTKKAGVFNVFGLLGNSWFAGLDEPEEGENFLTTRENTRALTLVTGIRNRLILTDKSYLSTILSLSRVTSSLTSDERDASGTFLPTAAETFTNQTIRLSTTVNHKFNAKHLIKAGLIGQRSADDINIDGRENNVFANRFKLDKSGDRWQSFVHWRWRANEVLTFNSGLHYLYDNASGSGSTEPRVGASYRLPKGQSVNLAFGLHSRTDGAAVYRQFPELKLTRALHGVLGYDRKLGTHTRLKTEVYYQRLFDVPAGGNFSALNARNVFDFLDDKLRLTNSGRGQNYGVELTLERFLNEGFYYLVTTSFYRARYTNDGKNTYSTAFDGGYIANALAGKEWAIDQEKRKHLGLNLRFTAAGGQRFTGVDGAASAQAGELVFSNVPFGAQIPGYYRADVGITYKVNRATTTHRFSLNVQNATNRLNPFQSEFTFDANTGSVREEKEVQNGLLPILKYRIDF